MLTPDNMIPMRNSDGKKFTLLYEPGHPQHGWIFYNNYGQWVTLRKATEEEMRQAKFYHEMLTEFRAVERGDK